jgi:hypothetical protein
MDGLQTQIGVGSFAAARGPGKLLAFGPQRLPPDQPENCHRCHPANFGYCCRTGGSSIDDGREIIWSPGRRQRWRRWRVRPPPLNFLLLWRRRPRWTVLPLRDSSVERPLLAEADIVATINPTAIKSPQGSAGLFPPRKCCYFFADFFVGAFLVAFGVAFLAGADFVAGPPISMLSAVTPFFFSASENHTGRLPRPDQVCVGFSGLRYFGATVAFVPLAPWPPRLG